MHGVSFLNHSVDIAALVFQLFVRGRQQLQILLGTFLVFLERVNLFLKLGLLLLGADALHAVYLTLHLLDLEVLGVDQLLLALLLDLQLCDVCLEVPRGGEGAADIADEVGLLSSELEQSLGLLEQDFFLAPDFFLHFGHHGLRLFELGFGVFVG